jgi:hypothetical protein
MLATRFTGSICTLKSELQAAEPADSILPEVKPQTPEPTLEVSAYICGVTNVCGGNSVFLGQDAVGTA